MGRASWLYLILGLFSVKTVSKLLCRGANDVMTFAHQSEHRKSHESAFLVVNKPLHISTTPSSSSDSMKELKVFGACYRDKFLCVQRIYTRTSTLDFQKSVLMLVRLCQSSILQFHSAVQNSRYRIRHLGGKKKKSD